MKSKYLFLILIVLSFFFSCSQEDELVNQRNLLKILRWNWNKLNWLFMLWGLILPL